jgi:hypothetical protein
MDEKVLQSITALLNGALTTQLLWTALVSVCAAAAGAYFGAYLSKKAERRATKEDFADILKEEIERTLQTENVKTAIAEASSRSLEHVRTDLQRGLAFVTFQRELIARHQDGLVSALRDCATLGDLALYEWQADEIDQNRVKMIAGLRTITFSGAMLSALGVIEAAAESRVRQAVDEVTKRWEKVFTIKIQNSARFRAAHPEAVRPGPEAFPDAYSPFEHALEVLADRVLGAVKDSKLPV